MSQPPGPPYDAGQPPQQPWQGGYPPPAYGPGPTGPTTNGMATASLITGIGTLVLSWCCGLGIAGVVAIVLGVKARSTIRASGGAQTGEGLALGGIITGAVAVVLGVLILVLLVIAVIAGIDASGSARGTSL